MSRSKMLAVKDMTEEELSSALIWTQSFLSGYCHPTARKSAERRLREIKKRIEEAKA